MTETLTAPPTMHAMIRLQKRGGGHRVFTLPSHRFDRPWLIDCDAEGQSTHAVPAQFDAQYDSYLEDEAALNGRAPELPDPVPLQNVHADRAMMAEGLGAEQEHVEPVAPPTPEEQAIIDAPFLVGDSYEVADPDREVPTVHLTAESQEFLKGLMTDEFVIRDIPRGTN